MFEKLALCCRDVSGILFPPLCAACGEALMRQERALCLSCLAELPLTGFHRDMENPVAQLFWGRVMVEYATAFISLYRDSRYRNILYALKYGGQYRIGRDMGRMFGRTLSDTSFMQADVLLAVPLHRRRMRHRGYNQSDMIARGMAEVMGKPLLRGLVRRTVPNPSQTSKSRIERWENVKGIFTVTDPAVLADRHVLLVDDVVTTGATFEACAAALLTAGVAKVSLAALAHVKRYD
jgi:ComF family protein